MDNILCRVEAYGAAFIIVLGTLLHFAFAWSGRWPPLALIAAVNESVWEHLKLGFWPAFIYSLFAYRELGLPAGTILVARTATLLSIPVAIAAAYYAYTGILGHHSLPVDIAVFIGAVLLGQALSYAILSGPTPRPVLVNAAVVLLVILLAAFSLLTYYSPGLPLFRDPRGGGFGLSSGQ